MLIANNLHKSYGSVSVLKGIDLNIEAGKVTALMGSSGAGKTTLLHLLGTLDQPDTGNLTFNGQSLAGFNQRQLSRFRSLHIGFVFQFHHLLAEFSALENVCIPGFIVARNKSQVRAEAQSLLEGFHLAHRLTHKPSQLSGGEQQRVAIARALINSPRLILADEPTGNLDTQNSQAIFELFLSLAAEKGIGFFIATHNEQLAMKAHRLIRIADGKIESDTTL